MKISLIAALAKNHVIGKDNDLIWHLPDDMQFFKSKTKGHCILTGRKNYESIPLKFRPLPNRTNLVVTRDRNYTAQGAHVFNSITDGIEFARSNGEKELFIIGGAEIYNQTIELANTLYLTWVDAEFDGDAFFPHFDVSKWKLVEEIDHPADENHQYAMKFCQYNLDS